VNGITLSDALTCWEQGQNEHNGAFRRRPGVLRHDADIYLLTGSRDLLTYCFHFSAGMVICLERGAYGPADATATCCLLLQ